MAMPPRGEVQLSENAGAPAPQEASLALPVNVDDVGQPRPFRCDVCQRSFAQRGTLDR